MEKTGRLKQVDNRIITLKRETNKLKDILAESGTYQVCLMNKNSTLRQLVLYSNPPGFQGFLTSLSPESWRNRTTKSGGGGGTATGASGTLTPTGGAGGGGGTSPRPSAGGLKQVFTAIH